jgi:hypothetical protein
MKVDLVKASVFAFVLAFCLFAAGDSCLAASPSLLNAKKEAEAAGYIFEAGREEIVARARKEGKLKVFSGLAAETTLRDLSSRFKVRYPFISEIQTAERSPGTEAAQRFLLEVKAGLAKGWDAITLRTDLRGEYASQLKKFDILGMARHGVLNMPVQLIDSQNRNVVAITSELHVVGYNKKLVAADKLPSQWEDFLKPEYKGKKFYADIRPLVLSSLIPVWGLEKTLDFARKIAAQEPIWIRGNPRGLTAVAAGERALFMGPYFGSLKVQQKKAANMDLEYKVIEPVPARLNEENGILAVSEHSYTALLWLEFLVSPEAQKIIDQYEPGEASLFAPGSIQSEVIRGKQVSTMQWEDPEKLEAWLKDLVKAYGFPNADAK